MGRRGREENIRKFVFGSKMVPTVPGAGKGIASLAGDGALDKSHGTYSTGNEPKKNLGGRDHAVATVADRERAQMVPAMVE